MERGKVRVYFIYVYLNINLQIRRKLNEIKIIKTNIEDAKKQLEQATRDGDLGKASQLRYGLIPSLEAKIPKEE